MTSATTTSTQEPMSANIKHVPRSGTVRTNGQELYYEIHGDGPPLVLVMGIGYDSSLWTLQQVPELSTRFRVVLLDNRDAGRSSRADHPYTIADMADDVAGLLDALDIHRTHLLGLSMGSMIGMEFALRHADRLDRLVLAGPGAAPARSAVDPISIWNWVKANDPSGEVFGAQQFTWLFSSAFLRNQQAVQDTIALLASNPNPVEPEAYDRQAQAYLQFDALDRLGGINAPTLVIVGEQDLLTPPWVAREVADGIPGARFELVTGDGSSHVVPLERPDDFNQLVMTSSPSDSAPEPDATFGRGVTLAVNRTQQRSGSGSRRAVSERPDSPSPVRIPVIRWRFIAQMHARGAVARGGGTGSWRGRSHRRRLVGFVAVVAEHGGDEIRLLAGDRPLGRRRADVVSRAVALTSSRQRRSVVQSCRRRRRRRPAASRRARSAGRERMRTPRSSSDGRAWTGGRRPGRTDRSRVRTWCRRRRFGELVEVERRERRGRSRARRDASSREVQPSDGEQRYRSRRTG